MSPCLSCQKGNIRRSRLMTDAFGTLFVLQLLPCRRQTMQTVRRTGNRSNRLQNGIRILRRHLEELLGARLSVERLNRTQIRVQLVDELMQRLIGELVRDIVRRISSKRIRQRLRPIQLPQPPLQVLGISDFHVQRKARIRQNINHAAIEHKTSLLFVKKAPRFDNEGPLSVTRNTRGPTHRQTTLLPP